MKIDLPHASSQPQDEKPAQVTSRSKPTATVLVGRQKVDEAALQRAHRAGAQRTPQPELHLRADRKVAYETSGRSDVGGAGRRPHEDRLRDRAESGKRQVS